MSEYLGVTYTFKASRPQKDGSIESDVEFNRGGIFKNVTFRFDDEIQFNSDFDVRCQNKIDKFLEKRTRTRTLEEVEKIILNYISIPEHTTVPSDMLVQWNTEPIEIAGTI